MRAREYPTQWKLMLDCIDRRDFDNANKIASIFFGGIDQFSDDKQFNSLCVNMGNKQKSLDFLKNKFNKETGFLVINRKYLIIDPITLFRFFFSEDKIEKYLLEGKGKLLINYGQRKTSNIHLFVEQYSKISYELGNFCVISENELNELVKKHKNGTYIFYDGMFFSTPYEFWLVFDWFDDYKEKKRRSKAQYLEEMFLFCEEGSISFVEKEKVTKEELRKSANKKIEELEQYNKKYVQFVNLKEKKIATRAIAKKIGLSQNIAYYFSGSLNFKNNKKDTFLTKEYFAFK